MFDLGFPELLMIFVVALVVLGPKRLPPLVAQVGRWVGKARAMARQFREQLEQEVNLAELNDINEKRAKEARSEAATQPPGEAPAASAAAPADTAMHDSGYPYAPAPAADAPQPGDDTYSHAHAAGAPPLPHEPPAETTTSADKDTGRVASVSQHE